VELPTGFRRLEVDDAVVVAKDAVADALLAAGVADPEALVLRSPAALAGRGRLGRVELPGAVVAIVRPLLRGGLLGKVVKRVSLDETRALAELTVSVEAAARGASVLEVLAAVTRRRGPGWSHAVVTREVPGARDLTAVLTGPDGPRARARALRAAGQAVRRLHDAGVDHVDLNLKNILLPAAGDALVIDLDRCRLGPAPASDAVREENLVRLLRSWTKLGVQRPGSTRPRDPLALLRGYAPGRAGRPLRRALVAAGRAQGGFPWRRAMWGLAR
jgi:3-deoxy-D-manno-octulosonic acid kinase